MAEKRYQREEVLEALIQATKDRFSETEAIPESEMLQLAEDLGVNRERLAQVLRRGTGSVRAWDDEIKGWGWPGDLVYERKIDGELTPQELDELADIAGEPVPTEKSAIVRQFGDNLRSARAELSVREGKTRILVRSQRPKNRPFRVSPLLAFLIILQVGFILATRNIGMRALVDGLLTVALLYYFGMQILMKRSEEWILKKVNRITESARQTILDRPVSYAESQTESEALHLNQR